MSARFLVRGALVLGWLFCGVGCGAGPGGLVVPDDYPTIQEAIDAAESGDTVRVKAGVYEGPVTLKTGVRLEGESRETVVIQRKAGEGACLIAEDCSSGEVSGFTMAFTGLAEVAETEVEQYPLLWIRDSSVTVTDCLLEKSNGDGIRIDGGKGQSLVRGCIVRDCQSNGIYISGGLGCTLDDNRVSGAGRNGISAVTRQAALRFTSNRSTENAWHGFYLGGGARFRLLNNVSAGNGRHGVAVTGEGTRAILKGNRLSENEYAGFNVAKEASCSADGNTIQDNGWTDVHEVGPLLASEQFENLERIASDMRKGKKRFPSGEWVLEFMYKGLAKGWGDVVRSDWERYLQVLDRWEEAYPASVTLKITRASAYLRLAWDERGGGWAHEVTEEGWQGFYENLGTAWVLLEEAEKLDASDPELYNKMYEVAVLRPQAPRRVNASLLERLSLEAQRLWNRTEEAAADEVLALFKKGVALEPAYYPLYYSRAWFLMPRWGGGPGELEAFTRHFAEMTQEKEGDGLYGRIARTFADLMGPGYFYHHFDFDRDRVQSGLRDIVERYPDSGYYRNWQCWFAAHYEDVEAAKALFEAIGESWDKEVWKSEGLFRQWKAWANGEIPFPGTGAVHYAVREKDAGLLREMLEAGPPLDGRDELGRTPVLSAALLDEWGLVEILLEAGADPNLLGWDFPQTALNSAIFDNLTSATKLLLEHGALPVSDAHQKWPLLGRAASNNNVEIVRLFIEKGMDVNVVGESNWPAIGLAAMKGHVDVVTLLIDNGADISVADVDGNTPLQAACMGGYVKIVKALLAKGADVDTHDRSGNTPLHSAARHGHDEVVALLLSKGADVNALADRDWTPLMMADYYKHASTAALLKEHGGS